MTIGQARTRTAKLTAFAGAIAAMMTSPFYAQALEPSDEAKALATEADAAPAAPADQPETTAASPTTTKAAAKPAPRKAPVIPRIRGIGFTNASAYLEPDALRAAIAPFVGQRATRATLSNLQAAVNALYVEQDIGLAQAVIESVQAGRVSIRLVEARLGAVTYNAPGLSDDYLRYRLGFAPGQLADTRRLTAQLQRLGWTDGLQADAAFSPGAAIGTTDLLLTYPPIKPVTAYVALDNYVSQTNGDARLSFGVTRNSLTGRNDPLSFGAILTEAIRTATLSYSAVVAPGGDRLGIAVAYERGRTKTAPIRQSDKLGATLSYSRPLILTESRRVYLTAGLDVFDESATFGGITTSDQTGASLSLGVTSQSAFGQGVFGWSFGLTAGRYDDRVTAQSNIGTLRINGAADWRGPVGDKVVAAIAGGFQLPTSTALAARDAFTVTAAQLVPGYDESLSAGPGGYWVRAQIETAQSIAGSGPVDLRPYAFAAMGEAYSLVGGALTGQGTAASIGMGLTGQVNQSIGFDLQLAAPQTRVLGSGGRGNYTINAAMSVAF